MSKRTIRADTLAWLNSEAMACDTCADRLEGVQGLTINGEARASEVGRLRKQAAMAKYAINAIRDSRHSAEDGEK